MKIFQQLLFIGAPLLLCPFLLLGQKAPSAFQFGLGVNALVSVTNTSPVKKGLGSTFSWWCAKPLGDARAIQFSVAYRQQLGFQKKALAVEIKNYPSETQVLMRSKEVASLHYLDANVHWRMRFHEKSPWSLGLGLRASHLVNWQGKELQTVWSAYAVGFISDVGSSGNGLINYQQREQNATHLPADNFRRMDFGPQADLAYEFLPGLQVRAELYQGLRSVFQEKLFPGQPKHRLLNFTIGLQARLF